MFWFRPYGGMPPPPRFYRYRHRCRPGCGCRTFFLWIPLILFLLAMFRVF